MIGAVALAGGIIGAVMLSALTLLLYMALEPMAMRSGQFVMVFAFTVPLGALLGAVIGVAGHVARRRRWRWAGWIATVGGAGILTLASAIVLGSADSRGGGVAQLVSTLLSLWIAPSWFAAAALVAWGIFQLVTRR